jgi:hypothetical protein
MAMTLLLLLLLLLLLSTTVCTAASAVPAVYCALSQQRYAHVYM